MGVDGIPLSPGFSADSVDSIAPADWSASDPVCNGEVRFNSISIRFNSI